MLRIYDFQCSSGEVYERLVESEIRTITCQCGEPAKRLISPIRCKLDHTFPGESIKWAKQHEKGAKKEYTR